MRMYRNLQQYTGRLLYYNTRKSVLSFGKSQSALLTIKSTLREYRNLCRCAEGPERAITTVTDSTDHGRSDSHGKRTKKSYSLYLPLIITAAIAWKIVHEVLVCEEKEKDLIITEDDDDTEPDQMSIKDAIRLSREMVKRKMVECGCPGLVISVSVDGKDVWKEGIGYADFENNVPCTPDSIFRIASISKSITMAAVARLWEAGALDLDKSVYDYVPDFPRKQMNGVPVDMKVWHLLCHLSGVRHYEKDYMNKDKKADDNRKDEKELEEYYIKDYYKTISESLKLFQDDPLVYKPGTEFLYTSHGWTLVSAVVEKAAGEPFDQYLKTMLDDLGLENTYMEHNAPIIPHRGRHYVKNGNGRIENAPYVDLSYKWAGGGLISNVTDLTKFGNMMLYCYQYQDQRGDNPVSKTSIKDKPTERKGNSINPTLKANQGTKNEKVCVSGGGAKPFLKAETVQQLWTSVDRTVIEWGGVKGGAYGLGWAVWEELDDRSFCKSRPFFVSHTGGAIGASSVLLVLPSADGNSKGREENRKEADTVMPKGVVVAIIVNMTSVGLNKIGLDIAKMFENAK